jgi:hypothetical protein
MLARFEKRVSGGSDRRCCTIYDFSIDLEGGPHSVWNRSASDVFVDDFIKEYQLEQDEDTVDSVRSKFYTRVKSIKQMQKETTREKEQGRLKRTRKHTVGCQDTTPHLPLIMIGIRILFAD